METLSAYNCAVCQSKDRKHIERGILAGKTFASLGKKYNVPQRSVSNHKKRHLSQAVADTMRSAMPELKTPKVNINLHVPQINNLSACINYIHNKAIDIEEIASERDNQPLRINALRLDLDCLSVAMRGHELIQSYESQGSWEKILPRILSAVKDYPEAKLAISLALREPEKPKMAGRSE